jgi:hypothetical protein
MQAHSLAATGRAPTDQFQVMCQQFETLVTGHAADLLLDCVRLDRGHRATIRAHQVMVVARLTDGVAMTPITDVNPVQDPEFDQQVKRPEDRRPPDASVLALDLVPDVLGAEVVLAWGDKLDDRLARSSQAVPFFGEALDDRRCFRHGHALLRDKVIEVCHRHYRP